MRPIDAVAHWLQTHGLACEPLPRETLDGLEKAAGQALPQDLHELYQRFGPGCRQVFSPVVHAGVVNSWALLNPKTSIDRMKKSSEPLWQLSPSVDIWLDTNEVTVLREDDVDESYPAFDAYWAVRALELERATYDPMTSLWLHPALHAQRVDAEPLRDFLLHELFAGREIAVPGIGLFSPKPPPKSDSTFDLNPQGPPPSFTPKGLDRCEPVDLDPRQLADRWGRDLSEVDALVRQLHHAVDESLEAGPVDLMGLFRLQPLHHEARVLANADEPIEIPAYRQVTARVSHAVAADFKAHTA